MFDEVPTVRTRPSAYLLTMPKGVLFGKAKAIEAWCAKRGKERPTLLDLALARREVKGTRP